MPVNIKLTFPWAPTIANVGRYIDDFVKAGADLIVVHQEACKHLDRTIQQIKEAGIRCGVALNPATSLSTLDYILDSLDVVLQDISK